MVKLCGGACRASGVGGRMHSPSGRPVGMPGAAAALRASGGDRLRTRSQSRHDSDEDLDDPTRAMDDFVAQRCPLTLCLPCNILFSQNVAPFFLGELCMVSTLLGPVLRLSGQMLMQIVAGLSGGQSWRR